MKYMIVALASVGVLAGPRAQATEVTPKDRERSDWIGFAVSPNGRVFQSKPGSEKGAREDAKSECDDAVKTPCTAISVDSSSKVTVIHCEKGHKQSSFVGGSGRNQDAADDVVYDKAKDNGFSRSDCEKVYTY